MSQLLTIPSHFSAMSQFLPSLLFTSALLFLLPTSSALPLRLNLTHIDSQTPNLTANDRNALAVKRSQLRMEYISSRLSSSSAGVSAEVQFSNGEYLAEFAVGTPPVSITALLDSGSDLIWTKCESGSSYNPSASSTYSALSCDSAYCQVELTSCSDGTTCSFSAKYGGGTEADGTMASETFSFSGTDVPTVAFGCSNSETGPAPFSGILGMGGGQLSLISQLASGQFSYCLTTYGQSITSPLLLGSLASPDPSSQSTPISRNPNFPTFYYLSLQGITVGSAPINGGGDFIIDSGTSITMLVPEIYNALKQEFQSQMGLPLASGETFDICFSAPTDESFQPPKLIFHFNGADIDFPGVNYLVSDGDGSLLCVAVLQSNQGFSLFGNFQQQNMHIVYGVESGMLYFAPAKCDSM